MKRPISAATALGAVLLAASCTIEDSRPAATPMVPAAAGVIRVDQAALVLAEARCDREARCNGIGPLAPYATRDHCIAVMRSDAQQNLASCAYGVKDREAQACAIELRRQMCGPVPSPFDWVGQLMVCRTANLCLH